MSGYPDTKEGWKLAEAKANQINLDILSNNFETDLKKYGLAKQPHLEVVVPIKKNILLLELYDLYCESRKGSVAETTLEMEFKGKFRNAIVEAIGKVGNDALAIRNYLVEHRQSKTVKECLRHRSKACKLGIKHKHIFDNPFEGMAEEIEIAKGKKKLKAILMMKMVMMTTKDLL